MLGMRLGPWVLLMSAALAACAGGGDGPSSSGVFEPTRGGNETGSATSSDTDPGDGTSSTPPGDGSGSPFPDASCCQVAPSPGCGNATTQACVCDLRPECCQTVWNQDCVDLASSPCADPLCPAPGSTGEPGDDTGSSGGPPTQSCEQLAAQEGWTYYRCQSGDSQCNDMGTPTTDCDFCCGYCNERGAVSCGDLAEQNGWALANCEWNGNGACNGQGTPTCDCNFCCEVG